MQKRSIYRWIPIVALVILMMGFALSSFMLSGFISSAAIGTMPLPVTTPLPLIYEDCSTLSNFTSVRGGTWTSSNGQCVLTNAATTCSGPICNLLIHNTTVGGDFTLNVQTGLVPDSGNWQDTNVIIGYKDINNYYFANFNESNNNTSNGFFRVQNGTAQELADFSSLTPAGTHQISIAADSTQVKIYRDGTLLATVSGSDMNSGKVGLGTFNNDATFDLLTAFGPAPPTPPVPTPTVDAAINEDCSSIGNFNKVRGGTWNSSNSKCVLTGAATSCSGPLCNLLIHKTAINGDFILTAEAGATPTSSNWDDFVIAFSYRDVNNYFYASFNETTDNNTNGIFKVENGTTTKVGNFSAVTTAAAHQIKIEKDGYEIRVTRDGELLGKAEDFNFTSGSLGFGSFNNNASFDNLVVIGQAVNATPTPTPSPTATPITGSGQITDVTYRSAANNKNITVKVYLPPGYNTGSDRYPVVYDLHGMNGSPTVQWQRAGATIKDAIEKGKVRPMIYVFANDTIGTSWFTDSDGFKAETTVIKELIPFIDERYRTLASKQYRAIDGFSMGGAGALTLSFKYPELFRAVVSYGAAIIESRRNKAIPHINENTDEIRRTLKIRMVCGSEDGLLSANQEMRRILQSKNIPLEFIVVQGVGHCTQCLYEQNGLASLKFIENAFNTPVN
jgi:enterochelin esterase-like enzyme